MKKIILSISLVISIAFCLLFSCITAANAQDSHRFVYNKSYDNEIVYLCDSVTNILTPYLKYEFTYNQDGKMNSKKAFRWDLSGKQWLPYYLFTSTFVGDNEIQEFALWSNKSKDFTRNKEKVIFCKDEMLDRSIYISFRWNEKNEKWEVSNEEHLDNYIAMLINGSSKKK